MFHFTTPGCGPARRYEAKLWPDRTCGAISLFVINSRATLSANRLYVKTNRVARSENYMGWNSVTVSMSGSTGEIHKFAKVFIPPICAKRNPTEWEVSSHRDWIRGE